MALIWLPMLLLGGADYVPASPESDISCEIKSLHVDEFSSLAKLPTPIKGFLRAQVGEMADRGEAFNSTDVIVRDVPSRRFIRAGHLNPQWWFVWYEQGGIAYFKNILLVDWPGAKATAKVVARKSYFHENPCALTKGLLLEQISSY
jgi:hypothetical protein